MNRRIIISYIVWFLTALMSDCFGWSIISFLIEFKIEMINTSYLIYINLKLYGLINFTNIHQFYLHHILFEHSSDNDFINLFLNYSRHRYQFVQQFTWDCNLVRLHGSGEMSKYGKIKLNLIFSQHNFM